MTDLGVNHPFTADPNYNLGDGLSYSKSFKWALIGHAALILAVLIKSLIFPGTPVIYHSTLRVDLVGLPDQLKNQLKATPPSAEIQKALKEAEKTVQEEKAARTHAPPLPKTDEMVLHPKKANDRTAREKKLKSALERIKALEKISQETAPSNAVIKGNRISKGTSFSADAVESAQANYYDSLRDRLRENWALPVWIARQNLSAQIELFIDARGQVKSFRFVRGSGNDQFDSAIKRAVSDSQPYPVPPDEIRDTLVNQGVEVGFPL